MMAAVASWLWSHGRRHLGNALLLGVLVTAGIALIGFGYRDLHPPRLTSAAELEGHVRHRPFVEIACTDRLTKVGVFEGGKPAWACPLGNRVVLVVGDVPHAVRDHAPAGTVLLGVLDDLDDQYEYAWPDVARSSPLIARQFLERKAPADAYDPILIGALLLLVFAVVCPVLWWRSLRNQRAGVVPLPISANGALGRVLRLMPGAAGPVGWAGWAAVAVVGCSAICFAWWRDTTNIAPTLALVPLCVGVALALRWFGRWRGRAAARAMMVPPGELPAATVRRTEK